LRSPRPDFHISHIA